MLHQEIPDDPTLRRQWNDLVLQMEQPEVFYTFEWASAVQSAYRTILRPLLCLAYEKDILTGLVALATDAAGKSCSFLAATTADYCEFISDASHRAEFVAAVLGQLKELRVCDLTLANLPEDSASARAIRTVARRYGFCAYVRPAYLCAQVNLGRDDARQSLKTALLHKKKLRHYLRAMEREGPVVLTHLHSRRAIVGVLPRFVRSHVSRFLATGRISSLASPERQHFLRELAAQFSDAGAVTLTQMTVGDRQVAWNYGFQFCGSWFWYLPTFDSRDESNSPGYCLLSKIIIEACDLPQMRVVDLGLGAEGYKGRFGNSERQTLHTTLTLSRIRQLREVARYRAAATLKRSPKLEAAIRRVLAGIQGTRDSLKIAGLPAFAVSLVRRLWERLFGCQEVLFYEGAQEVGQSAQFAGMSLRPIDLEVLADGVTAHPRDLETHSYLLHSAQRLRANAGRGFALLDSGSLPVHFCWVGSFAGFHVDELKLRLGTSEPNAVVIFDDWTPTAVRGKGYCGAAARLVCEHMRLEGKSTWVLRAPQDALSLREIEGVGFQYRYLMRRRRVLAWRAAEKICGVPSQNTKVVVGR